MKINKRSYKSSKKGKMGKFMMRAAFFAIAVSFLFGVGFYFYITKDLPTLTSITDYRPDIITKVYSDNGTLIGEFATERREIIPISKAPKLLIQAFVAAEDDRFFEHEGLDFISILRAFIKNVRAGGVVQGGSTITQQVAKSLLTSDRTLERKIKEAILAYRIESNLTKNEILFLYLNQIYLGYGAYGVQAASHNYYKKDVNEMNLSEMAILAGLPQAPSKYSPSSNPKKARERRDYVLNRMVDEGYINIVEATDAMNTPVEVEQLNDVNMKVSPYFTEHIRRYLESKFGADTLYKEGLEVYTTVKLEMQKAAQKALKRGLIALDKRQGYRGPLRSVSELEIDALLEEFDKQIEKDPIDKQKVYQGVVVDIKSNEKYAEVKLGKETAGRISLKRMKWARKPDPEVDHYDVRIKDPAEILSIGDVIEVRASGAIDKDGFLNLYLHQEPLVQGAIIAITPKNGFVRAMVGGFDFETSKFNRAVQSRRQPGSAFKPIIYSSAIDKGYTSATIIMDSPVIYKGDEDTFTWKPKNYDDKFHGPTTLRKALTKSRNVVTIKIAQDIGLDYLMDYTRRMGIKSRLTKDLSLSLGSSGMSLLEITSAYGIFAAGGQKNEPVFITKILDRDGNILEELSQEEKLSSLIIPQIAKEQTLLQSEEELLEEIPEALQNLPEGYAITPQTAYIMTNILEGVVQHGTGWRAKVLGRPVAGKTGTTNDQYDAWFIGFTPDIVAGTWVGFDQENPLGKNETGSRVAAPIFVDFMKDIYKDKPVEAFPVPDKIEFAKIDKKSGLLAAPNQTKDVIFECFKEGTAPTKVASEIVPQSVDFFRQDL